MKRAYILMVSKGLQTLRDGTVDFRLCKWCFGNYVNTQRWWSDLGVPQINLLIVLKVPQEICFSSRRDSFCILNEFLSDVWQLMWILWAVSCLMIIHLHSLNVPLFSYLLGQMWTDSLVPSYIHHNFSHT